MHRLQGSGSPQQRPPVSLAFAASVVFGLVLTACGGGGGGGGDGGDGDDDVSGDPIGTAVHRTIRKADAGGSPYGYIEYLPAGYTPIGGSGSPLVVFLHGSGERGTGNDATELWNEITRHGPHKLIKNGSTWFDDNGVVVCSPQVELSHGWWRDADMPELDAFFDHLVATYNIDQDRIYLTGISMGGGGTWNYVHTNPGRIAACIPICGARSGKATSAFDDVPTWAFHAFDDGTVNRDTSIGWVDFIAASIAGSPSDVMAGYSDDDGDGDQSARFNGSSWSWSSGTPSNPAGTPNLTMYRSGGHDSWTRTYANQDVWDWLIGHRASKPSAIAARDASGHGRVLGLATAARR